MTVNIIGCGETGAKWDGTGDSIGVNDCLKFGHPVDYLMVLDNPERFTPERREIILNSAPEHFVSNQWGWMKHFSKREMPKQKMQYQELHITNGPSFISHRFSRWKGTFKPDRVWYSNTSTFPAITLAVLLGYKKIVLWGVDFVTHRKWNHVDEAGKEEIERYKQLCMQLNDYGVGVYLGAEGSALSFLEVYNPYGDVW